MSACTVQKVLATAAAEVGTMESPANSNNVKYNTWYYGRAVSGARYAWCLVFLSWCFGQCGGSKLLNGGKKTASCSVLTDYAKKKNQWGRESRATPISTVVPLLFVMVTVSDAESIFLASSLKL